MLRSLVGSEMCIRDRPRGPYLIGGICFGCHVALEMAQRLRSIGEEVSLLAMIDPSSPVVVKQPPKTFLARLRERIDWLLERGTWLETLWDLLVLRQIRRTKRSLGRTFIQDKKQFWLLMEVHLNAQKKYVPQIYSGKFVLFRSKEYESYEAQGVGAWSKSCLLYTSPSPRDS